MKISIVGTRNPTPKQLYDVKDFLSSLDKSYIIVSGGAKGIDSYAVEEARRQGFVVEEIRPILEGVRNYSSAVKRYYERNAKIVDAVLEVHAWPNEEDYHNKKGGTYNTIKTAIQKGKIVHVYLSSCTETFNAKDAMAMEVFSRND